MDAFGVDGFAARCDKAFFQGRQEYKGKFNEDD